MNINQLESTIQKEAEKHFGKALNKNALKKGLELLGSFGLAGKSIESLTKLFLERGEVKDNEVQKAERKAVLKFLCEIDESIINLAEKLDTLTPTGHTIFAGEIDIDVSNAKEATGAHVNKPTEFKPGTRIKVKANNVDTVTGLKVG